MATKESIEMTHRNKGPEEYVEERDSNSDQEVGAKRSESRARAIMPGQVLDVRLDMSFSVEQQSC